MVLFSIPNHLIELREFQEHLVTWGRENYRQLPWRIAPTPYRILVAEIMLHRTQARQVVPVFNDFVRQYPSLGQLAQANQAALEKTLYPLGLPQRVELLTLMIIDLITRFNGEIPEDREHLLSLPGISDYIASAVRCFAFNRPDPLMDTNTVRIFGRIFGLVIKDSSRRNSQFRILLSEAVSLDKPQDYNYALLDLAHLICTKCKEPACQICPLVRFCIYGSTKLNLI